MNPARSLRLPEVACAPAACLVLALLVPGSALAERHEALETYEANLMSANGGNARNRIVNIRIERWSTDEDRADLLATLKSSKAAKDPQALPNALLHQKEAGVVSVTGSLGYELRYARKFQEGDKAHIILATNRPVAGAEVMRGTTSQDYNITVITLTVDADGKGTGVLSQATELEWDEKTGRIEPHTFYQPTELQNVRRLKDKKK